MWLTAACTYPIVVLVLPRERSLWGRPSKQRDFLTIIPANLASFGFGELAYLLDLPQTLASSTT